MALFGAPSGRSGLSSGPKALCEFKAGKMTMDRNNLVTPDKRKGLVQVDQGAEDQLMHLRWKDRTTGTVEDDLIIFPDDIEFKRVSSCTTGRVFVLKFKSSSKRMFFWMQEPKTDKDEDYAKKVNDLLNNPPAPGSAAARGGGGGAGAGAGGLDLSSVGDSEITSLLSNMSQQQLVQLLNGAGGANGLASLLGAERTPTSSTGGRQRSTARAARAAAAASEATPAAPAAAAAVTPATPATPANTGSAGANPPGAPTKAAGGTGTAPIQLSDLQNILSGINIPAEAGGSSGGASGPAIDLSSGLTGEALKPLLQDKTFVAGMKDLLPPEHDNSSLEEVANEISHTVQSPQFQQAMGTFSSALQTGQLAPLIQNFKLGDAAVAAAAKGDMEAFVKAVQKHQEEEKKKKKDDEPEDMALD